MENTYQTYYNQIAKTTGILFKARRFLIPSFSDYKNPILFIDLPLS